MTAFSKIVTAFLIIIFLSGFAVTCAASEKNKKIKWTSSERKNGYVVFQHNTLMLLPDSYMPDRKSIVNKVSCTMARGEYESIQIGIHVMKGGIKDIKIDVESELEVKVYHRISLGSREKNAGPFLSSIPPEAALERGNVIEQADRGKSTFFWLTFHCSAEIPEGLYKGRIVITPEGKPATELILEAQVHPFKLQRPRIAYGMYHSENYIPQHTRSDEATIEIYRDMAEHGQNSVTFYGGGSFKQLPPKNSRMIDTSLPLAAKAGLLDPDIPCMVLQDDITILPREQMRKAVTWLQAECSKQGWPEIIQYGWDEPPYPAPGLRETFSVTRTLPIRIATAITSPAAYAYGDLHDVWLIHDGDVVPGIREEAYRLGAEEWTYSYRLWREGYKPLRQRFFAGYHTWAYNLKGNYIWAYYDNRIHSFVWWRTDETEPMPMVGWEARREGIDDYRYLQMLDDCVSANMGDPLAVEAAAWLEALRTRICGAIPNMVEPGKPLEAEEFDTIRAKAADYIQKLGPVPEDNIERIPAPHLKDEAKMFRGKSVNECIRGISSPDVSVRRSAAWALFEHGPNALPALESLIGLLDDPEVRIPSLHALEAIGSEAYPAIPKIAALFRHPDGFVRLGAAFTLGAMGSLPIKDEFMGLILGPPPAPETISSVEPLRLILLDEYPAAAHMAGKALACYGTAAAAALPEAMEVLDSEDWNYWWAGMKIIAAAGPKAAPAVPKLIERYESNNGGVYEAKTLAAIGPAAKEAIPVLEKFATKDENYPVSAYYALYCIRGNKSDLFKLVDVLKSTKADLASQKTSAISYLAALGVKAAPAADAVRDIMKTDTSLAENEGLQLFLERVENNQGPAIVLP
ncbi:HEAT repeat domain-containing protein [Candidatus Omnitrophota bacterium]